MEKKRIEWIDTAKGLCIILVVINHMMTWTETNSYFLDGTNIDAAFQAFRMPLYFTLSGLFFKAYDGFLNFVEKKINKLIVPFIFFYLLCVAFLLIIPSNDFFIEYKKCDYTVNNLFFDFYNNHCSIVNGPLWFLLCLFEMNVLFYIIFLCFKRNILIIIASFLLGFLGLWLSSIEMNLPCNFDSALVSMPFFCIGYFLRKYGFLEKNFGVGGTSISLCIIGIIIIYLFAGTANFSFGVYRPLYTVYPLGIIGVLILLYISQQFGKVRYVSYLGRYSIIILCTHYIVFTCLYYLYVNSEIEKIGVGIILCNVIMWPLMYNVIIPLCLKYIPWFVAQKDIVKFVKSKNK